MGCNICSKWLGMSICCERDSEYQWFWRPPHDNSWAMPYTHTNIHSFILSQSCRRAANYVPHSSRNRLPTILTCPSQAKYSPAWRIHDGTALKVGKKELHPVSDTDRDCFILTKSSIEIMATVILFTTRIHVSRTCCHGLYFIAHNHIKYVSCSFLNGI